jgi:hypothetical protein
MITKIDKQVIIDTYIIILNDFFVKFLDSEINNYENNNHNFEEHNVIVNSNKISNCNLFIGISIIHRIFEFIFQKTKNINTIYYYSNEAISYYLEYINQVYKANLFNNLNQADAVVFVYKKIIFELRNKETIEIIEIGSKSILSNIIDANKSEHCLLHLTDDEFNNLFFFIKKNTDLLLSWKHSFSKKKENIFDNNSSYQLRIEFFQEFIEKFLKKKESSINFIECLELFYLRFDVEIETWKKILQDVFLEISKKNKKKGFENVEDFLLKLNIEKNDIQEKLENSETKSIVNWILK